MAQELERLTRGVQLAAAGRLRRPGRIITRDLRRKEKLGWRNWIWIYNDAAGMAVSLLFAAAFITVLNLWWSHTIAIVTGFTGLTISLVALVVSGVLSWYRTPQPARGHLTHEQRRMVIDGERSRRKAPHAKARRGRQPELEFNYNQYSVDIRYREADEGISIRLLEHTPWKDNRYKSEVYKPTTDEMKLVSNGGKVTQLEAERWLYPFKLGKPVDQVMDLVYEQQRLMEALAEGLEQDRYERELKRLSYQRIALVARR